MRSNFDLVDQNNEGTNANLHWLESFQKKISPKESFYGFVTFRSGLIDERQRIFNMKSVKICPLNF